MDFISTSIEEFKCISRYITVINTHKNKHFDTFNKMNKHIKDYITVLDKYLNAPPNTLFKLYIFNDKDFNDINIIYTSMIYICSFLINRTLFDLNSIPMAVGTLRVMKSTLHRKYIIIKYLDYNNTHVKYFTKTYKFLNDSISYMINTFTNNECDGYTVIYSTLSIITNITHTYCELFNEPVSVVNHDVSYDDNIVQV